MRIRVARPDDAAAVVALRAVVFPYLVRGVAATRQLIADPPPGADWRGFLAEVDARPVGWVAGFRNILTSEPGCGEIAQLQVHPEYRGRGVGTALFDRVWRHLADIGIRRVRAWSPAAGLGFARRRGFAPAREMRYAALDLSPTPPVPATPDDVTLVAVSDVDPRDLYAADVLAAADEPGDVPLDAMSYEAWRHDVWDNVGLDRRLSVAAAVDGRVVSFSLVQRDGARIWSDFTGTVPRHRGRGLARLVKAEALRRAADSGVTAAYTSNDESNAPMLAVNRRLGYRPVATQFSCLANLS